MNKLLIANRGEIAVRVIRAAREMGITTVAIYSDADEQQMHVKLADEAVALGASEPSSSYLDLQKVIAAAKSTGAEAIHPGYGFLSERAEFSQACQDAGIKFVGPPAEAMRKLGSKIESKQLAVSVGVPVTPGYFEPGAALDRLREEASKIGYPIMLKASAGGGGRGMRVVREPSSFDSEFSIASDEALKGFGNGAMMIEKLIDDPRHIEVQFLADAKGNVVCLFERDCSIQRRHQKLIEEAPSPAMSDSLWDRMRQSVSSLVKASGCVGAGTAEFMFDEPSGQFYFLEVNARLQVEHPVTETITGLDLVQWQLRIADGEELNLPRELREGDRRGINGHAIEARIVSEDPAANFRPSVGRILAWAEPKMPGVRVDTGYGPGAEIPRYYDSLIAKVIAQGETREQAIRRLEAALRDFHILGVQTNIGYLLDVLAHEGFRAGRIDTGFLGREFAEWKPNGEIPEELPAIASRATQSAPTGQSEGSRPGVWDLADGFRVLSAG